MKKQIKAKELYDRLKALCDLFDKEMNEIGELLPEGAEINVISKANSLKLSAIFENDKAFLPKGKRIAFTGIFKNTQENNKFIEDIKNVTAQKTK